MSAWNVIDYIEYMWTVERVNDLSDSLGTALAALPMFLNGNPSAKRGWEISHRVKSGIEHTYGLRAA